MKPPTITQHGYSLIELVVYIGIMAALVLIIVMSLVNMTKTYAQAQGYRRLQINADTILERFTREVHGSNAISSGTYGSSPGTVTLSSIDSGDTAHTLIFSVASGALQVSDNAVVQTLSTNEVVVTTFTLHKIIAGANEGLKVELTLTTSNGYVVSSNFYTTVMLRNK